MPREEADSKGADGSSSMAFYACVLSFVCADRWTPGFKAAFQTCSDAEMARAKF